MSVLLNLLMTGRIMNIDPKLNEASMHEYKLSVNLAHLRLSANHAHTSPSAHAGHCTESCNQGWQRLSVCLAAQLLSFVLCLAQSQGQLQLAHLLLLSLRIGYMMCTRQ